MSITASMPQALKVLYSRAARMHSRKTLATMIRHSITIIVFMTCIVKINAQQKGTYITLDQTKEIVLLDSNRIVIKQTDFKKNFEETVITGTFKRKLYKLIVHPNSITINNEIDVQNKPYEIVYKVKSVTGQKFMIKRLDRDEDYQIYYLKNSLHFGIE